MEKLSNLRAFLLLRYTLILATAYLLLVEGGFLVPAVGVVLLIVAALLSNVAIAQLPPRITASTGFTLAIIVADTAWITAVLLHSAHFNAEFYFLYFFLLLLAGIGESLALITVGAVAVCIAYIYLLMASGESWTMWNSPSLIRIPFLFTAAAFYGHLADRTRQERRRADAGEAERRETARQLARLESDLSRLIETANAPIVGIDQQGLINEWNQKAAALTGYDNTAALGRTLTENFVPEDHRAPVQHVLDQALAGQETSGFEFPLQTQDGRRVIVLLNATTRRDAAGTIVGVWGVGQDVTELSAHRERLEQLIDERTRELTASLQREQQLSSELKGSLEREKELGTLKSRFVSMASHEFRTPLTTVLSASEVLKHYADKLTPEEKVRRLDKIQAAVKDLTALLDDILTVDQVDAERLNFRPVTFELKGVCDELVDEVASAAAPPHDIRLSYAGSRTEVHMDPKLLRTIMTNLLSNAIKYSPPRRPILVDVTCENGTTQFRVTDDGIGVPEPDRERLFEPFHRGTNVGSVSGTGLGLAIVKRAVDLHAGKVSVDSQLGRGTTVTVTIPFVTNGDNGKDSGH